VEDEKGKWETDKIGQKSPHFAENFRCGSSMPSIGYQQTRSHLDLMAMFFGESVY